MLWKYSIQDQNGQTHKTDDGYQSRSEAIVACLEQLRATSPMLVENPDREQTAYYGAVKASFHFKLPSHLESGVWSVIPYDPQRAQ